MSFAGTVTSDGSVTLKPPGSPVSEFLWGLFFCVVWNGVVSVVLWQVVKWHRAGNPEWYSTLFLMVFVVMGIGAMIGVVYSFLKLLNPQPELTLSRARLPLGTKCRVKWRFRGSTRSIRKLKLSLKGQESATQSDRKTDETSYEHVVYEADDPMHIASGDAEFVIPSDSMHSFTSDNNRIVWSLQALGEIARWPDVNINFPIQVTPHEQAAHRNS